MGEEFLPTERNALLSAYDKSGIVEFAKALYDLGFNLYGSGGTARAIAREGVRVTDVKELVGGGAILGHRVVTLSREVCSGCLAQYNDDDRAEMAALGIPYMDLVCCNLYPLQQEIAKPGATVESVHENTDIGGPTMLNAAAKSKRIVVCDVADYDRVLEWLRAGMRNHDQFVHRLAAKAFRLTGDYYTAAAEFHEGCASA